jgi:hypothetical protein
MSGVLRSGLFERKKVVATFPKCFHPFFMGCKTPFLKEKRSLSLFPKYYHPNYLCVFILEICKPPSFSASDNLRKGVYESVFQFINQNIIQFIYGFLFSVLQRKSFLVKTGVYKPCNCIYG